MLSESLIPASLIAANQPKDSSFANRFPLSILGQLYNTRSGAVEIHIRPMISTSTNVAAAAPPVLS